MNEYSTVSPILFPLELLIAIMNDFKVIHFYCF